MSHSSLHRVARSPRSTHLLIGTIVTIGLAVTVVLEFHDASSTAVSAAMLLVAVVAGWQVARLERETTVIDAQASAAQAIWLAVNRHSFAMESVAFRAMHAAPGRAWLVEDARAVLLAVEEETMRQLPVEIADVVVELRRTHALLSTSLNGNGSLALVPALQLRVVELRDRAGEILRPFATQAHGAAPLLRKARALIEPTAL